MAMINVDFEVFKELTLRRPSEEVTENDVLRELLGLPPVKGGDSAQSGSAEQGAPWVVKGVSFPHGTEFRATHKGQLHTAKVDSGALLLDGKRYPSPSAAAVSITGNPVNGWRFWECRFPGSTEWRMIAGLRD